MFRGDILQFFLTFLEGLISFISPCVLPLLPVYISYFAGGSKDEKGKMSKILFRALAFVFGITLVYALLGLTAGVFGSFLSEHRTVVNIVCGSVIIFFGLCYLGVIRLGFLKGVTKTIAVNGIFSAFLFGIIYSVSLSPCTGVFLGTALSMAANSGSAVPGVFLLVTYSLGLGIPFVVSALVLDKLRGAFGFIKKHYGVINSVCGILLVAVGILMAIGIFDKISTFFM